VSASLAPDAKAVLCADALMFLWALLLGVWKYQQIRTSTDHVAHVYVDIAHRVALFYSFALLLVTTFVELSGFAEPANLAAAGAMAFYFFAATAGYARHGRRRDTDNQFRDAPSWLHAFMLALVAGEIGGWLTLVAGFLRGQVF